jgi:hypothetical protein
MRRLACLVGIVVLGSTALQTGGAAANPLLDAEGVEAAGPRALLYVARAEAAGPRALLDVERAQVAGTRALLDAPRAKDVAVAGGEVLLAATTSRGGARLRAVPVVGGATRDVLEVPGRGRGWKSVLRLASSAELTALLVGFLDPDGNFREWELYAGPPSGPLALVQRVRRPRAGRVWTPMDIDVHGDRLLIHDLRQPGFAFRLTVRAPDGTAPPLPRSRWGGHVAVAGEQLAYLDRAFIRIVDWRTGQLSSTLEVGRHSGEIEDRHLDMTDGARVVAAIDGRLITGAPGVPVTQLPGSSGVAGLAAPRFAGERVAALAPAPRRGEQPVVIDPAAGTLRRVGPPSTDLRAIAANETTVAWLANGCMLAVDASPVGAPALDAPPPGPCPRAEVALGEEDDRVRGRTLRVRVICVAAPAPGCSGEVLLGKGGWAGRGRFRLPPGARRSVRVRLSRRGIAQVRRQLRLYPIADFSLTARVEAGRLVPPANGTVRGVSIERIG